MPIVDLIPPQTLQLRIWENATISNKKPTIFELVDPLHEYLSDGVFRQTNNILNKSGMILTVGDELIPAYLQLRETEAWLAKAIEGEEFKPPWFNGSSEPTGTL